MNCPYCEKSIGEKSFKNTYIICCEHCKYIYSLRGAGHLMAQYDHVPPGSDLAEPDIDIGTDVILIDARSRLFLEFGVILKNDPLHSRVDFNGTYIWIPKNVLEKVPKEWL